MSWVHWAAKVFSLLVKENVLIMIYLPVAAVQILNVVPISMPSFDAASPLLTANSINPEEFSTKMQFLPGCLKTFLTARGGDFLTSIWASVGIVFARTPVIAFPKLSR